MNDRRDNENQKENTEISCPETPFEQLISYNVNETERPGGLKIRFKVKIVTGRRAAVLDERQAEAIRGLLLWARQYRMGQSGDLPGSR